MADVVRDPLHAVALSLTVVAAICQVLGSFLPNWWMLVDRDNNVAESFSLFGDIECSDTECFPTSANALKPGQAASWLGAIRIMGIIGMALVFLTLLIQLIFLAKPLKKISIAAIAVLFLAGLISFINGFMIVNKYAILTQIYMRDRNPNALVYNAGASALILISFILCIVAAVFTGYGMRRPTPKAVYNV